jgi:hypothetical protein
MDTEKYDESLSKWVQDPNFFQGMIRRTESRAAPAGIIKTFASNNVSTSSSSGKITPTKTVAVKKQALKKLKINKPKKVVRPTMVCVPALPKKNTRVLGMSWADLTNLLDNKSTFAIVKRLV